MPISISRPLASSLHVHAPLIDGTHTPEVVDSRLALRLTFIGAISRQDPMKFGATTDGRIIIIVTNIDKTGNRHFCLHDRKFTMPFLFQVFLGRVMNQANNAAFAFDSHKSSIYFNYKLIVK